MIELLYEVLKLIEQSRGSPLQAEQVDRLVIQPLRQVLRCVTVLAVVLGAIVVAAVLSGKDLDLGPSVGRIGFEWLAGGAGALTLGWTLVVGQIRRWREGQSLPRLIIPQQRGAQTVRHEAAASGDNVAEAEEARLRTASPEEASS